MSRSRIGGVAALLTTALLLVSSLPASAWTADVQLQTATVTTGINTTLNVFVRNTWARGIRLNAVNLTADWPGGPRDLPASGTPRPLDGGGDGANFAWLVSIPADLVPGTSYDLHVAINATEQDASGLWGNSSGLSWTLPLSIINRTVGPDGNNTIFWWINPLTPLGAICWFVVILLLVLIFVVLARRPKRAQVEFRYGDQKPGP